MIDGSVIEQIAALAEGAREAEQLQLGGFYVVASRDGDLHRIDLTGDEWRDLPKRKCGTVTVRDVASFAEYWHKHSDAASEVYADREHLTITGVLDAHEADQARWGGHRVVLGLRYSEAWKAWASHDGKSMDQEAFAEFLDDNRADILNPPAAEMLEIASSLQATTKAEFQSGIAVFEGAAVADQLAARFRYRINNGRLALHYKLDRPADVVSSAFEGAVHELAEACSTPVLRGTPTN